MIPCIRIVRFRADKGGEYIGKEFQADCLETGIRQKVAAAHKPHQIGVFERVVRTPCAMVQCFLVDSSLSPNHWRELMLTRVYLCNPLPHLAPQMETPQKASYVNGADQSQLKGIGTRTFGARTRRILEAKNVVIIETPLHLIPQLSQLYPLQ